MGVMLIDTAKPLWFAIIGVVCAIILGSALLLGFLGPEMNSGTYNYAYDCPNNQHVWDPYLCTGVQMGSVGSDPYVYELPQLSTLNGFWSLIVYPYNKYYSNGMSVTETLYANTTILGRDNTGDEWVEVSVGTESEEVLLCGEGESQCWGFLLVYNSVIKYAYYGVQVYFPDDSDNLDAKSYIGDVLFEYQWYNAGYIEEEMTLRVVYLVLIVFVSVILFVRFVRIPISEWTVDQKLLGFLLFALVAMNNPFYPFEFLVSGPFFAILDAFFQVIHQCILLLYWLIIFDYIRMGNLELTFTKWDLAKPIAVLIYGIFTFTLYMWFGIADQINPVYGELNGSSGWYAFVFMLAAIFYAILLVWVAVLILIALPPVLKKRYLLARYFLAAIPTSIILTSTLIGLFFGTLGPIQRSAAAFCYFFTLYNLYVWILVIGYWPVTSSTVSSENRAQEEADEDTPIATASLFGAASSRSDNLYGGDDAL